MEHVIYKRSVVRLQILYEAKLMFDDDLPKPKTSEFPRNLENMSVDEIDDYVAELRAEIERCEADKAKKKASMDAAANVFKS